VHTLAWQEDNMNLISNSLRRKKHTN